MGSIYWALASFVLTWERFRAKWQAGFPQRPLEIVRQLNMQRRTKILWLALASVWLAGGPSRALARSPRVATAIQRSHAGRKFRQLWQGLEAKGSPFPVLRQLERAYGTAGRHYHTLEHVSECLARLETLPVAARQKKLLALALWFHDAVYLPGAKDNERRSARLAARTAGAMGLSPTEGRHIASLIKTTAHDGKARTKAERTIADLDLAILASDGKRFARYEKAVRREYAAFSDQRYTAGRAAFVAELLQRKQIFATPLFQKRLEKRARKNLEQSLSRLQAPDPAKGEAQTQPAQTGRTP